MGSQTALLGINDAQLTETGSYQVIVSNSFGVVTSSVAVLSVDLGPTITNQPQNLTVVAGVEATFNVGAAGTGPLFYQWRFNGTNLTAASNSSYTVSSAQTGNAGNYSVVVSNAVGSVTSSNAALIVIAPQYSHST